LFDYNPLKGELIRRITINHKAKAGDIVGCPNTQGHLQVRVNGVRYYVHQIVWLYHYGEIPDLIDHIDQNPKNNKIDNLRPANKSLNALNCKKRNNKSGHEGICYFKWGERKNRWLATITVDKIKKYIGYFSTKEEAIEARNSYKKMVLENYNVN